MHRFGIMDPDIRPRATREIEAMQEMISLLIERGNAYPVPSGDVYFSVRSDHNYGILSGRDLDQLRAGELRPPEAGEKQKNKGFSRSCAGIQTPRNELARLVPGQRLPGFRFMKRDFDAGCRRFFYNVIFHGRLEQRF